MEEEFERRRTSLLDFTPLHEELQLSPQTDKKIWESDSQCISCQASLGIDEIQKFVCKFCYRAVCEPCSPQKLYHEGTAHKERCCDVCLNQALEQYYDQSYKREIKKLEEETKAVKEEIKKEIESKALIYDECRKLEAKVKIVQQEAEKNCAALRKEQQEVSIEQQSLKNTRTQLTSAFTREEQLFEEHRANIALTKNKISSTREESSHVKDHLSQLKQKLNESKQLKIRVLRQLSQNPTNSEDAELLKELNELAENSRQLEDDLEELADKSFSTEQEIKKVDHLLHRAKTQEIPIFELTEEDKAKITELRLQVEDQRFKLLKLHTKDTEDSKEDFKEDFKEDSKEEEHDPFQTKKCTCVVF